MNATSVPLWNDYEQERRKAIIKTARKVINDYNLGGAFNVITDSSPRKKGIAGKDIKFLNVIDAAKDYIPILNKLLEPYNAIAWFSNQTTKTYIRIQDKDDYFAIKKVTGTVYLPKFGSFRAYIDEELGIVTRNEKFNWPEDCEHLIITKKYKSSGFRVERPLV